MKMTKRIARYAAVTLAFPLLVAAAIALGWLAAACEPDEEAGRG